MADETYHERGRWMLHIGADWALLDIENCGEPIRARVTHDDLYALRSLLDDVLDPPDLNVEFGSPHSARSDQ